MATDFYERQYQARRSTKWLIAAFALAVVAIVGSTAAVAWLAVNEFDADRALQFQRFTAAPTDSPFFTVPVGSGLGALSLIGLGSLFKTAQLRGGGHVVAESLNGRRVFPDTTDPVERRLLNVVEEMALASGVPTPPVFLLAEEQGINAFAAGYAPSDAVVAVTRGCAEQLTRDELQGVVAHEFSHILNGDMRLNIRMIGVLYGILLMGLIGRILIRIMADTSGSRPVRRSSSSDKKGGDPRMFLLLIGVALVVLGYVGTLIGSLIKAAISRQREFLADASAVQLRGIPTAWPGR